MKKISLSVDAVQISVEQGATVLEAACQAGITIPTLCYLPENKSGECGNCGVCAVACEGRTDLPHACCTPAEEGMVIITDNDKVKAHRQERVAALASVHFGDCKAPCSLTCPGQINVQGYIAHIAKGQYAEAVRLIMEKNPLPFSVGRLCRRFCESRCRRVLLDEPIAINHLKRFAADWCMSNKIDLKIQKEPATGKKIAVIGGGPGGLSGAYYLAKNGHAVTVFEAEEELGGLLRYSVPEFKLPKKVLDYEIGTILELGIEVRCNHRLGRDITLDELNNRFDAILLTIGAGIDQPLEIPGVDLPGVFSGLQSLRQYNTGDTDELRKGKTAAVIGGNNIALENARSLIRLGYEEVTVVSQRADKSELSAGPKAISEAVKENVHFLFMVDPCEIRRLGSGLELVLTKMEPGEPDEKGRRQLQPVPDVFDVLLVDTIIHAQGQMACSEGETPVPVDFTPKNLIKADTKTAMTSMEKVYAAGEAATGSRALIQVVSSGRKAAENIHADVMGIAPAPAESRFNFTRGKSFDAVDARVLERFERRDRTPMPDRHPEVAVLDNKEVRLGFDEEAARQEADRCLECGCMAFDDCDFKTLCIDNNVNPNKIGMADEPAYSLDSAHPMLNVDLNKCVYCRRCVNACEYNALELKASVDEQGRATGITLRFNENCVNCGNCADHCSTGTITKKDVLSPILYEETRKVRTTCPYCGAGCQMQLKVKGDTIMEATSEAHLAPNYGALCVKGRFAFNFAQDKERLTTPLVRRDDKLVEATWDEAYTVIAERMTKVKKEFGPDSIAGFSCARATNEENFLMQKFMRTVIGTNNIDHCARL
jgi:formate dehydrogenase major subunit